MRKHLHTLLLPVCLALSPLAGCQSFPASPAPATATTGMLVTGEASLTVQPRFEGYHTQSTVSAYTKSSIQHLMLKLYVVTTVNAVEQEAQALDGAGQPIQKDNIDLDKAVTFTGLKGNTTYRVKALAYKAAGTDAAALISVQDANSYVTVALTDADPPATIQLRVKLRDRDVSLKRQGGNTLAASYRTETIMASLQPPKVAYNTQTHESLMVWADDRDGVTDIYARRIGADGAPTGGDVFVCSAANEQSAPAVAYNSQTNQYLVVWQDQRNSTDDAVAQDIYARRIGANGLPSGADFAVCTATGDQQTPALAYDAKTNEFLVVWTDFRNADPDAPTASIYGQWVGASQAPNTAQNFAVSTPEGNQDSPAVACNPQVGRLLVVWSQYTEGANPGVRAAWVFDASNTTSNAASPYVPYLGSAFNNVPLAYRPLLTPHPDYTTFAQRYPAVAYNDQTSRFLVVWADQRWGEWDLYGQSVPTDQFESLPESTSLAFARSTNGQEYPALAYNSQANEFLVAWADDRNDDIDIYAQRINGAGTGLIGAQVEVSRASDHQQRPALAYNGYLNEFWVMWQDSRSGISPDLYGQRLESYVIN